MHDPPTPTLDEIVARLAIFTDEQRSLAWSPQPPYVATGAHDCREGGDGGLDFNYETPLARWRRARYRWTKENTLHMFTP
jgi:hypothetical protein